MIESRKPVDGLAGGAMAILCLVWGLQQVVLKAAVLDVAPVMLLALRSAIAAPLVWLVMHRQGEGVRLRDGYWRPGLVIGLLFAFEYLLVGEALRHTSAGHSVIFLYTAPIFAGLGLHWRLPSERMRPAQWLGIALAFSGIAAIFLGHDSQQGRGPATAVVLGDLLALGAGISWGATTVIIRCSRLSSAPAAQTLFYQLVVAFFLLYGAALWEGQTAIRPTAAFWGSLLFQSLIVSFASFLAWFWLLRRYLASRLGVFAFMSPLFGVMLGVVLLGEPLEPNFMAGAILVIGGIILVSGDEWLLSTVARFRGPGR